MLTYLAEKSSVSVQFRCGLSQKLHSVTKDVLLFFLFFHDASLCGNSDNFILILPSQDGCTRVTYCLFKKKKKMEGEYAIPEKAMRCGFIRQS